MVRVNVYSGLNREQRKKVDRELKIRMQPKMVVKMHYGRTCRREVLRMSTDNLMRLGIVRKEVKIR